MLNKQGYMHARTRVAHAHMPQHTHERARVRTHTATMIRKSISLLRFTYNVCLVLIPHSFSVETNIRLSSQEIEFPSRDPKLYYDLRNTEPLGPILK